MRKLLAKIRRILKDRRTRQLLTRTISLVAAIVVFVTTYALVLPAITMESEANCGIEAHQHDSSCYEDRLICGEEESPGHHHSDACYEVNKNLVCSQDEHRHGEECYDEEGSLICGLPEHTHNDSCYEESRELVCGIPESDGHQHTDSCYEKVLICGKEVHTHSTACYSPAQNSASDWTVDSAAVAATDNTAAGITVETFLDDAETMDSDPSASSTSAAPSAADDIDDGSGDPKDAASASADGSGDGTDNGTNDGTDNNVDGTDNQWSETADTSQTADANTDTDTADTAITDDSASDGSESSTTDPAAELSAASTASTGDTVSTADTASASATASTASAASATTESTASASSTASTASTATGAATEDSYVPTLDPVDFNQILTDDTGIYYYHAADGDTVPETSGGITDWKPVENDTILDPADIIRVYLAYSIPAGTLNNTNPVARYRLPSNIHLSDKQVESINSTVNGIANQYVSMDTLEITDPEKYSQSLGVEAIEGTRNPSDDIEKYFKEHKELDGQEYISAVVRVEDVYDNEDKDKDRAESTWIGTDLVFTFTPYSVQKNQHTYDKDGMPTSAGQMIQGWLTFDLRTNQIDFETVDTETMATDEPENTDDDQKTDSSIDETTNNDNGSTADAATVDRDGNNNINTDEKKETTRTTKEAEIVFVPETKDPQAGLDINEISETLRMQEIETETGASTTADGEAEKSEKETESEETENDKKAEEPSLYCPAQTFQDSITASMGTLSTDTENGESTSIPEQTELTVYVEADEGTFPEGTTMKLSTVEDMDAVASAVEGAVTSDDSVSNKTRGFHAVDISFWNKEGKEIEPLKPIRVSMKSESIKQAVEDNSTAPVVVHIEEPKTEKEDQYSPDADNNEDTVNDATPDENKEETNLENGTSDNENEQTTELTEPVVTILETEENAASGTKEEGNTDTLTFEAGTFSVYAIVYTVDFHWEMDGKEYVYSITGGSAITLRELLPIVGIVADDPDTDDDEVYMFLNNVEIVIFSNPELLWVEKANVDTTVGEIEETRNLSIQYSSEVTEEYKQEIREKQVQAGDWALISMQSFESDEKLTIRLKDGTVIDIHVTDAIVNNESDFLNYVNNGREFYIFTNDYIYDYYLKYDGTTQWAYYSNRYNNEWLQYDLGDDYVWRFTRSGEDWIIQNVGHPNYYITLNSSSAITSTNSSTVISIIARGDYGFQFVNPNTSLAINYSNYRFTTVDRYMSWGAAIELITKPLTIIYTQDEIEHGNVSFYYDVYGMTIATFSPDFLSFSIDTNSVSSGEQSAYKVTATPVDGYRFVRWDASGDGYVVSWGSGSETQNSATIQPFINGGDVVLTAVFEKNPDLTFTQDDLNHGYVQYNTEASTISSDAGTPELLLGTKTNGQAIYAVNAVPKEGYHFVRWDIVSGEDQFSSWGSSNVVTQNNQTIQPYITGNGVKLKAVFEENPVISVTQEDISQGCVKYNNGSQDVLTNNSNLVITVPTAGPSSDGEYYSVSNITAEPADGYRFVRWEISEDSTGTLEDWGNDSTVSEKSSQIRPYIKNGNVTLTAVFEEIPPSTNDLDPNSAAGMLVAELQEELKRDSAKMTKTAHVLDEDKRTYQINLTASSERKVIGPKMTLSFITDISRSMYFPANLREVVGGVDVTSTSQLNAWLNQTSRISVKNADDTTEEIDRPNVYYMILDINDTATMMAIYKDGTEWKVIDASYYYKGDKWSRAELVDINGGKLKENGNHKYLINDLIRTGVAKIYTAYSTSETDPSTEETTTFFTRLDYLKKAVKIISDVIYAVDPNAELGLVTFAKGTKNHWNDSSTDAHYTVEKYNVSQKEDFKSAIEDIVGTGGTRQDYGLMETIETNWYSTTADHPQVAILVTDGAPQGNGTNEHAWGDIGTQANLLKDKGVELYTLGLSLDKVGSNKASLFGVSGYKDGNQYLTAEQYQHNAETGEQAVGQLMDILRSLEVIGNLLGSVSDTVDEAFYPIDTNGKPIEEGVYKEGTRLGDISDYLDAHNKPLQKISGTNTDNPLYSAKNDIPYYTWTQNDGKWTITWYNQLIEKAGDDGTPGWEDSIQVKAREDFLGGNAINTNADVATISADRYKQQGYPTHIGRFDEPVISSVETPRVNVVELGLDSRQSQWTVYLDTAVNSIAEIKALYNAVQIHERVTKADSDNRIAADGISCNPSDITSAKISLSTKLPLSDSDWNNLIAGQVLNIPYTDYHHRNIGTFKVELKNEGTSHENTLNGTHPASPVGNNAEKYTLSIIYTPNPEDATTIWNTTENESRGREAQEISSVNTHTMTVYAIPLRVIKYDDNNNRVPGADFSIYRLAKNDEVGISIEEYDETKTGDIYYRVDSQETDQDGICTLAQPAIGETSPNLLVAGETYYLIETAAPEGYLRDENVKVVTLETTTGKYTDLSGTTITSPDYPYNWNQGATIKIDGVPGTVVDPSTGWPVQNNVLVDEQGNPRTYLLNSDPYVFQTRVTNIKLTDIAIKKVDVGNSDILLANAVFSLYGADAVDNDGKIKQDAVAIQTGITTLTDLSLGYADLDPLEKGTFYLVETAMPDGYIAPAYDYIRITITANQVRYQEGLTGEPKTAEIITRGGKDVYCIQVYNNPGVELPSCGGFGTHIIYMLGCILVFVAAGFSLVHKRGLETN